MAANNTEDTRSSTLTRPINRSGIGEGVDRKVERLWWQDPRRLGLLLFLVLFVGGVAYGFWQLGGERTLNVDRDRVTIAGVEYAPFQEYIAQSGTVQPQTTVYLDAVSGGRVEEVFIREGTMVEEGDPLLRLSNHDIQLRLLSTDAQRMEMINQLQDMRFRMEQNALSLRQQLAEMNYRIQRLSREYERNQELYAAGHVSSREYEEVRDEYEYVQTNRELTLAAHEQDSLRMAAQMAQMETSLARMEANYEIIEQVLDDLVIRAPVSGFLTSLDAEVGQLRGAGDRFGQVDVLDGYKVRADIDEFYLARVDVGQRATTQPLGGTEYEMEVRRVFPEVQDGRFAVELEFADAMPDNIRRGQTIRFRLELGAAAEATLIPRGGFYQSTGGNWVFVVDPSGQEATRRPIRIGRQNPQYFEVLEGVEPGERVVTSGYDTFGNAERLRLR